MTEQPEALDAARSSADAVAKPSRRQEPERRLRLGILGAGMIATVAYGFLPGLRRIQDRVHVAAIASRTRSRAAAVAGDWGIPAVYDSLGDMLADGGLDAVLNLTPIPLHYETSMQILAAGKHLVTEKPLASTLAEADDICGLAEQQGLQVVCAPADMLGYEWIEARRLVRGGAVGRVAFARVHSSHAGPAEMAWPVDPTWFYQQGAGPLLDMGVYGLDRITGVLGPARRVVAMSGITERTRLARGGAFDGLQIPVTEDDNTLILLDFGDATYAVVDATFNVVATKSPQLELFGLSGTLIVNRPGAAYRPDQLPIELFRLDAAPNLAGWIRPRSPAVAPWPARSKELSRAILVDHLADILFLGAEPAAGPDRARHVLEIMTACRTAAREYRAVSLTTTFPR